MSVNLFDRLIEQSLGSARSYRMARVSNLTKGHLTSIARGAGQAGRTVFSFRGSHFVDAIIDHADDYIAKNNVLIEIAGNTNIQLHVSNGSKIYESTIGEIECESSHMPFVISLKIIETVPEIDVHRFKRIDDNVKKNKYEIAMFASRGIEYNVGGWTVRVDGKTKVLRTEEAIECLKEDIQETIEHIRGLNPQRQTVEVFGSYYKGWWNDLYVAISPLMKVFDQRTMTKIMREYLGNVFTDAKGVERPIDFFPKPRSFSIAELLNNPKHPLNSFIQSPHLSVIAPKADGYTMGLVVDNGFLIPFSRERGIWGCYPISVKISCILEGELTSTGIHLYDMHQFISNPTSRKSEQFPHARMNNIIYSERYEYLSGLFGTDLINEIERVLSESVILKKISQPASVIEVADILADTITDQSAMDTDGAIITISDPSDSGNGLAKWKPPHFNSIDVELRAIADTSVPDHIKQKFESITIGYDGFAEASQRLAIGKKPKKIDRLNDRKVAFWFSVMVKDRFHGPFGPDFVDGNLKILYSGSADTHILPIFEDEAGKLTERLGLENISYLQNSIVEVVWVYDILHSDDTTERKSPTHGYLYPLRLRDDKTTPNSLYVSRIVLHDAMVPILPSYIKKTGQIIPSTYFNKRSTVKTASERSALVTRIMKAYLYDLFVRPTHLEIGFGRGGDIERQIYNGVEKVYAIEPDLLALQVAELRAASTFAYVQKLASKRPKKRGRKVQKSKKLYNRFRSADGEFNSPAENYELMIDHTIGASPDIQRMDAFFGDKEIGSAFCMHALHYAAGDPDELRATIGVLAKAKRVVVFDFDGARVSKLLDANNGVYEYDDLKLERGSVPNQILVKHRFATEPIPEFLVDFNMLDEMFAEYGFDRSHTISRTFVQDNYDGIDIHREGFKAINKYTDLFVACVWDR